MGGSEQTGLARFLLQSPFPITVSRGGHYGVALILLQICPCLQHVTAKNQRKARRYLIFLHLNPQNSQILFRRSFLVRTLEFLVLGWFLSREVV